MSVKLYKATLRDYPPGNDEEYMEAANKVLSELPSDIEVLKIHTEYSSKVGILQVFIFYTNLVIVSSVDGEKPEIWDKIEQDKWSKEDN